MKLPLFEEVREARRLAVEADDAARLHIQAGTALSALSVASAQVAGGGRLRDEIPGAALLAEAMERFDHLQALRDLEASAEQPLEVRLGRRRQQLLALQELLAPIASQQQARTSRVHHLQHEQFHHLNEPGYAELFQEIEKRNQERADLQLSIVDQRNRLNGLSPACDGLDQLLPALRRDVTDADDPAALLRARARLAAAAKIVAPALALGGLPIPLPEGLTATHQPLDVDAARDALASLEPFAQALRSERDRVVAEIERLNIAYTAATQWILDRTG